MRYRAYDPANDFQISIADIHGPLGGDRGFGSAKDGLT